MLFSTFFLVLRKIRPRVKAPGHFPYNFFRIIAETERNFARLIARVDNSFEWLMISRQRFEPTMRSRKVGLIWVRDSGPLCGREPLNWVQSLPIRGDLLQFYKNFASEDRRCSPSWTCNPKGPGSRLDYLRSS